VSTRPEGRENFDDAKKLLAVLGRLVDPGNTVVVIEHNLYVIKTADWIIDLGPEGASRAAVSSPPARPNQLAALEDNATGRFLRPLLNGAGG